MDFGKAVSVGKIPADVAEHDVLVDTERDTETFFYAFEHLGAHRRGLRTDRSESASRFKKPALFDVSFRIAIIVILYAKPKCLRRPCGFSYGIGQIGMRFIMLLPEVD